MHLVRCRVIIDRCRFDVVPLFTPKVPHKKTAEIVQGQPAPSQPAPKPIMMMTVRPEPGVFLEVVPIGA